MDLQKYRFKQCQKFTTPVDYLTLNDGRQVLVLNDTIYNFLKKNSVIDS